MSIKLQFDPHPLVLGPHGQTLIANYFPREKEPYTERRLITLPDGDVISLEISEPKGWKKIDLSVVLIHGGGGNHLSPYIVRMTNRLTSMGIRAIRFNMRGCGSGVGLAKKVFHSGLVGDVECVLRALKEENPSSDILLVGYSVGANLSLKFAGDFGDSCSKYLKGVIAIAPPVDLHLSVRMIGKSMGGFYDAHFSKIIKLYVDNLRKTYKLSPFEFPEKLTLFLYDDLYKAPTWGFKNAMDYYQKCSAVHVVEKIKIPCKILFAEDDPWILPTSLDHLDLPPNVEIYKTEKGGHLGFLGNPKAKHGFRFLEYTLQQWIQAWA
jgi:predicted alpha/beta-fold hydrolase